jgi:hypothetical protein
MRLPRVFADRWNRFIGLSLSRWATPVLSQYEDGFLWVDRRYSPPRLMMYDAEAGQHVNVGTVALTGTGLPAGGTTGQVLAKASGVDYDTAWASGAKVSDGVSLTAGLQTTGSTSWADLPGATVTLTTTGGNVLLTAALILYHDTLNGIMGLTFAIDGVDVAASAGYGLWQANNPAGSETPFSPVHLVKALSAGSHTFKLRWKTNTGTLYAVQSADSPMEFSAVEV